MEALIIIIGIIFIIIFISKVEVLIIIISIVFFIIFISSIYKYKANKKITDSLEIETDTFCENKIPTIQELIEGQGDFKTSHFFINYLGIGIAIDELSKQVCLIDSKNLNLLNMKTFLK